MKILLTKKLIQDRLSLDTKPVYKPDGTIQHLPRVERTPYIIFDADQNAPTGFGVKVAAKLTFIIQRRVGKKVIKAKVGEVNDFESVDQARAAARKMALEIEETKENPNTVAKEKSEQITAAKTTVAKAFALYREHLVNRQRPAKDSSLKNYDLAARRLDREGVKLLHRPLGKLRDAEIIKAFDTLAKSPRPPHPNWNTSKNPKERPPVKKTAAKKKPVEGIRTATEQTFRWASVAANFAIKADAVLAAQEGRAPSMLHNPFDALKTHERFRDRIQLEKAYEKSAARNPLSLTDGSLGRFLNALWARRQIANYQTACDYLLLTLLWGTRRGEAAPLKWRERITEADSKVSSWVDIDKTKQVFIHDTKNHSSLSLPLAPAALEILKQRRDESKIPVPKNQRQWVFPARSSRAVQGHYLDSKAILTGLRKTAEIEMLRTHDLRRTFGAVAEQITSYAIVKRLLNHKSLSDPTERYTKADEARVVDAMERIERAMLDTAPIVATALLPLPGREGKGNGKRT